MEWIVIMIRKASLRKIVTFPLLNRQ